jgi:glyoxylase-like metal-dependent hydrolase (beta-lactamase superfamily II)
MTALGYTVLHLDPRPLGPNSPLPNGDPRVFQPMAITLVSGTTDAVLIDPPTTEAEAEAVGDWVAASGKNLTHIAVTHGHGDHWFTAAQLARRFDATVVATPETVEVMRFNDSARAALWDHMFPGQIGDTTVTATTVAGNRFTLEGHDIVLVPVGAADCVDSSVIHVPDLELVVAGDVLYNEAHMFLGDAAVSGTDEWREAIAKVAALRPRHVVASHGDRTLDHDADRIIAGSLAYLDSADTALADSATPVDYFTTMLTRYPHYKYGKALVWVGAKAIWEARKGQERIDAVVRAWLTD